MRWFDVVAVLALMVMVAGSRSAVALENGLARTPPMGWMSWERFRCNVNCTTDPDNCISERLFVAMADAMVRDGFKDAGYQYVNIDDCWLANERDAHGQLQADPERFPHGIAWLAEYVHSKGLKLGLYEVTGAYTCQGYPGMEGHYAEDIALMASWGIDMLKVDGCNSTAPTMNLTYPLIGELLAATERPIVYSCSWPDYARVHSLPIQYPLMTRYCNLWRNYDDIEDSFDSVAHITAYWANPTQDMLNAARPGAWNDPDQLIIGNFGLTEPGQWRIQMGVWSMVAGPLLMSNDLRTLTHAQREVLLNREVIAVNQDALGRQGQVVDGTANATVWTRDLASGSIAVLALNLGDTKTALTITPTDVGFSFGNFHVRELWSHADWGRYSTSLAVAVPPRDCLMFVFEPVV